MWLCDASLAPPDVIHQAAPNRAHRVLQPIPLGGQHVQQLATPGDQRIQRLHGRIRERTRRGTDSLGEQRQAVGMGSALLADETDDRGAGRLVIAAQGEDDARVAFAGNDDE